MLRRLALITAGVAALTAAAPALAADHTGALSPSARTFTWDSAAAPAAAPLGAFDCGNQATVCDTTLIHVTGEPGQELGTFVASIKPDDTIQQAQISVYISDASGAQGDLIGDSGSNGNHAVTTPAEEGYYLIVGKSNLGYGALHGTAELLGSDQEFSVAAPDKKVTMNAEKTSYTWTGMAGSGAVFDCGEFAPAIQPCEDVLVHITEPGDLQATISNASPTTAWDYLSIYRSDQAGTRSDDNVVSSANTPGSPNESTGGGGLDPGYYVVEVGWLAAANATYDGAITFTPAPPDDGEE